MNATLPARNPDAASDTTPTDAGRYLPALPSELQRVRLNIRIAEITRQNDAVRQRMSEEHTRQGGVRSVVQLRLGQLRRDLERMQAEVQRLESRLERLNSRHRAVSDAELDSEEHAQRAEEAAFWAAWRQQREERTSYRDNQSGRRSSRNNGDAEMQQLYREVARLIHPDLARTYDEQQLREAAMRLANTAWEQRDYDALRQLQRAWQPAVETRPDTSVSGLQRRIADLHAETADLQRQLRELRQSEFGDLSRRTEREFNLWLNRQHKQVQGEIASQRLKRRRLTTQLEERRKNLSTTPTASGAPGES